MTEQQKHPPPPVRLDSKRKGKLAKLASEMDCSPSELLNTAVDRLYQSHVSKRKQERNKNDNTDLQDL